MMMCGNSQLWVFGSRKGPQTEKRRDLLHVVQDSMGNADTVQLLSALLVSLERNPNENQS